ncbi:MAG: hypothetical protein ACRENE_01500 [Polyangiaceae bacterium]
MTTAAPAVRADPPAIGDCLLAAEASLKLRGEHKLKGARTQLLVCSSPSCPGEVRSECMKRIDEVNAASPTIVLAVKDAGGRELSQVKVTVDGVVVADHLDGSALAVDPGAHEFKFETSIAPPLTETIILHEGEKDRKETVNVQGGTPAPGAKGSGGTGQGNEIVSSSPPPDTNPGGTQRMIGIVTGGVGVVGLALGSVFGILASSSWNNAKKECLNKTTSCPPNAMSDRTTALGDATISTVGFIAGGVLAATGVVLFFTAPKAGSPQVGLEAKPGGFAVTGTF